MKVALRITVLSFILLALSFTVLLSVTDTLDVLSDTSSEQKIEAKCNLYLDTKQCERYKSSGCADTLAEECTTGENDNEEIDQNNGQEDSDKGEESKSATPSEDIGDSIWAGY